MLFGQFVGTWNMDVRFFDDTGTRVYQKPGEWSFAWVLDGRAIQDVLIFPDLDPPFSAGGERRIGTTLRLYDPEHDTWQVVWVGATSGLVVVLSGRQVGDEIWIEGREEDGTLYRWMFTDIGTDHFLWKGLVSAEGSDTWILRQEMAARRRKAL
ncbi:MAG: hypothetical protein ACRDFT_00925 [bacterium]